MFPQLFYYPSYEKWNEHHALAELKVNVWGKNCINIATIRRSSTHRRSATKKICAPSVHFLLLFSIKFSLSLGVRRLENQRKNFASLINTSNFIWCTRAARHTIEQSNLVSFSCSNFGRENSPSPSTVHCFVQHRMNFIISVAHRHKAHSYSISCHLQRHRHERRAREKKKREMENDSDGKLIKMFRSTHHMQRATSIRMLIYRRHWRLLQRQTKTYIINEK